MRLLICCSLERKRIVQSRMKAALIDFKHTGEPDKKVIIYRAS